MATISSLTPASLASAICYTLTMTKDELSRANIPAALAAAAEKSKDLITNRFSHTAFYSFQVYQANLSTVVAVGATGVSIYLIAAPGAVGAPALAAAGFGTSGIVARSTAAGIHSGIGSVLAPSLFATLQSAGAGGYGATTVYGTVQAVGGAIASSATGAIAWTKART